MNRKLHYERPLCGFRTRGRVFAVDGLRARSRKADAGSRAVLPMFEVDARFPIMPDPHAAGRRRWRDRRFPWQCLGVSPPAHTEEDNATLNGFVPHRPFWHSMRAAVTFRLGRPRQRQYEWFNRGGFFSTCGCQSARPTGGARRWNAPAAANTASSSTTMDNVWLTGNGNGRRAKS